METAEKTPGTTLDILSDPICPWCYIGKAKFDAAMREAFRDSPDVLLDIHWRVFQLNPDMPEGGMGRAEYLNRKFGGPEGAKGVYGRIEQAVRDAGLPLDFSKITRTPNTLDAHRLIRWARTTGAQEAVVDALFAGYFVNGVDIGDRDALIEIGVAQGMDEDLLRRLYAEDADRALLENEDALAREMGVTGVPCFVIDETYALVGAQETETWRDVLGRIAKGEVLGA